MFDLSIRDRVTGPRVIALGVALAASGADPSAGQHHRFDSL